MVCLFPLNVFADSDTPSQEDLNRPVISGRRATVTAGDFFADLLRIPEEHRGTFALDARRVTASVNNLLKTKSLAAEARELGLDKLPQNQRAIQLTVDRVLSVLRLDALDATSRRDFEQAMPGHLRRARELYLINPSTYTEPEQVNAAHILIETKGRSDQEARALAERIRGEALSGTPFTDLVARFSEDTGSKAAGGDVGYFSRGVMVKPFAEAAFAMSKPGEISPAVKSQFGYHVIRFLDRKQPRLRPFDEVRDGIIAELREKYIQEARTEHVQRILDDQSVSVDFDVMHSLKIKLDSETYRKASTEQKVEEAKARQIQPR